MHKTTLINLKLSLDKGLKALKVSNDKDTKFVIEVSEAKDDPRKKIDSRIVYWACNQGWTHTVEHAI